MEEWNEWDDWLKDLWLHAESCTTCRIVQDSIVFSHCEEGQSMVKQLPGPIIWENRRE